MLRRSLSTVLSLLFFLQSVLIDLPNAHADSPYLSLPASNEMLLLSQPLEPVLLQGLRYNPQQPFQFEFILEQGDHPLPLNQLRDQGMSLVRYFMAAMTMPEKELWVKLSPYEKNRIVPADLGVTRLGSDMLVQDYVLKQLASSLTFPDSKTGSNFWKEIYSEAQARFGKTDVPVSTFNKVWIVPDYAEVLIKDNTVVITDSHLKVMMEQDYLAQKKAACGSSCLPSMDINKEDKTQNLASNVMRQVIIPVLENEVNTGSHFAALRQMFHAVVLAEWYKRNLKMSLFNQYYADAHKVAGIDEVDKQAKEAIYKRYLSAYKKGVYNFIREDSIPGTDQIVPRKYFSGGLNLNVIGKIREIWNITKLSVKGRLNLLKRNAYLLKVGELPTLNLGFAKAAGADFAMSAEVQKIFFDTETVLKEQRQVSPKVKKIMGDIDPLIIPLVTEDPVSITESWEKINLSDGYIEFRHSRVGLNIKTSNDESLEDGSTTKGGIRYYVEGTELFHEKAFQDGWNRLNALHAPIEDFREFISMYMRNGAWNLAFLMFEKVKLLGLPLGGAKADVFIGNVVQEGDRVVIKNLPKKEKENALKLIAKRHGEVLAPFVGIGKDSPAPDVATADLMGIYAEEGIKWLILKKPQSFEAPLLMQLQNKLREIERNPSEFPLGEKTPLLEMLDDYATKHHVSMPQIGVYSGTKKHGGLLGRTEATGIGVINVLMKYLTENGVSYKGMKISLQGMGAVGYYAALYAIENGFIVTDFSDKNIAVSRADGWKPGELDRVFGEIIKRRDAQARQLREYNIAAKQFPATPRPPDIKGTTWWEYYLEDLELPVEKRIFALPGVTAIINQEKEHLPDGSTNPQYTEMDKRITETVLGANVDVLIPAFLGEQITKDNWKIVKAKYLAEGANHPVDNIAQVELTRNGVHIILPGILSNSNGVFSSYLQILQALRGFKFTLEEVQQMGRDKLESVTREVIAIQKKHPELTVSEACELLAWINAARDQLRVVIKWVRGDLGEILMHYPAIDAHTMMQRIKQLGLMAEFRNYRAKNLQELRLSILYQLDRMLQNVQTPDIMYLTEPTHNEYGEAMALTRTLDNILKGETVNQALERLKPFGFTIEMVRKLRSDLLEKVKTLPKALESGSPNNDLYKLLQALILNLDRPADLSPGNPPVEPSSGGSPTGAMSQPQQYPGANRPSNAMIIAKDGGIDFNLSHMLIDQKGEANFQLQTQSYNSQQWGKSKGFVPIFLSMISVNMSTLMGI